MKVFFSISIIFLLLNCFKNDNKVRQFDRKNLHENKKSEIEIDQSDFQKTVYQIINAYNEKNFEQLNKFISPNVGVYFIYRIGTVDLFKNENKICINKSCPEEVDIPYWYRDALLLQKTGNSIKLDTIKNDIVEECDSVSKKGLFYINNETSRNLLTKTIKNYIKSISYENSDDSKKEIRKLNSDLKSVENWEKNSRRIVFSYTKEDNYFENTFIFYVTQINGKWYLTTLDFVST